MSHVYRKKPIQIEAFQMTQERMDNNADWPSWLHEAWNRDWGNLGAVAPQAKDSRSDKTLRLEVFTSSGIATVCADDWIIKGVAGELYPCSPDIFAATYEPADSPEPTGTEGIVAAAPGRPMTYGERAVGLDFNPSGNPAVYQCKAHFAALIDQANDLRNSPRKSPEQARLCSIAITELQTAQMRAVKALTWKE